MSDKTISRTFFKHLRATGFRLLVIALAVTGLGASAWAWLAPLREAEPMALSPKAGTAPSALIQDDSGAERVEAEIITITPRGFEPAEITRPAGRFLLSVHNRSGLEEVDLRINMESGARVREDRLPLDKPRWRRMVSVPPGRYVITEANHPDWVCRVTITAP